MTDKKEDEDMLERFLKSMLRMATKHYTKIPFCCITFNWHKYKRYGKKGSCVYHVHPILENDAYLKKLMFSATDYIRNNYDLDKFKGV